MNWAVNRQRKTSTASKALRTPGGLTAAVLIGLLAVAVALRSATVVLRDRPVPARPPDRHNVSKDRVDQTEREWAAEMNDQTTRMRQIMVEHHLRGRDITDSRVLEVMNRVPRDEFVPPDLAKEAYADRPLPIGEGQTISQPYIVALMTQLAQIEPESRVLDIGTGSGYQAAILGELCDRVYSIEIVESLAEEAQQRLARLGYDNVEVRAGDGYAGWPEAAPFDAIIVAAAPPEIPQPLIDQLAPGGRMVIPVGTRNQDLVIVEKDAQGATRQWRETPVAFVPMTGKAESSRSED